MPTVRYSTINGEIIAEKRAGVRRTYVPDPLGSTRALLDNQQQITDTFDYWPYGEVRARTGVSFTGFQFLGALGYMRQSSRSYYVRARYLNAAAGRWYSYDPLLSAGAEASLLHSFDRAGLVPVAHNGYEYASNNPRTVTDRSGLFNQDVYISCSGLTKETYSTIGGPEPCEQCCVALMTSVELGVPVCVLGAASPGPFPIGPVITGPLADCKDECEKKCTNNPSGGRAVRDFVYCVFGKLAGDAIVGRLLQYMRRRWGPRMYGDPPVKPPGSS